MELVYLLHTPVVSSNGFLDKKINKSQILSSRYSCVALTRDSSLPYTIKGTLCSSKPKKVYDTEKKYGIRKINTFLQSLKKYESSKFKRL